MHSFVARRDLRESLLLLPTTIFRASWQVGLLAVPSSGETPLVNANAVLQLALEASSKGEPQYVVARMGSAPQGRASLWMQSLWILHGLPHRMCGRSFYINKT